MFTGIDVAGFLCSFIGSFLLGALFSATLISIFIGKDDKK